MFFNFGFSEPATVTLEQYIGNALVHSQQLSAPPEILQAQFMQLVQQVASQSQPMKIRMVRLKLCGTILVCLRQKKTQQIKMKILESIM